MLRRPTSFQQLCAEAKVVEMSDPIAHSGISDDDEEEEYEGSFICILSIVMFKYAVTSVFFRKSAVGIL